MKHEEKLAELQAELARQDEALATAMRAVEELGDVDIRIAAEALREIEDACTPRASVISQPLYVGIRA